MIPIRIKLAWHVLRGRPLAYRVHFIGGGTVSNDMRNGKIIECVFENLVLDNFNRSDSRELGPNWIVPDNVPGHVEIVKLPPLQEGDVLLNQEWWYSDSPSDQSKNI